MRHGENSFSFKPSGIVQEQNKKEVQKQFSWASSLSSHLVIYQSTLRAGHRPVRAARRCLPASFHSWNSASPKERSGRPLPWERHLGRQCIPVSWASAPHLSAGSEYHWWLSGLQVKLMWTLDFDFVNEFEFTWFPVIRLSWSCWHTNAVTLCCRCF